LDSLENGPLDTLGAGGSGQGSVVAPEIFGVQAVKESFHTDLLVGAGIAGCRAEDCVELLKEQVIAITTFFAIKENTDNGS